MLTGFGPLAGNTLTTDNARSSGVDSRGRYFSQDTSAVVGNSAGWAAADKSVRMDQAGCVASWKMAWPTVTSIRMFCGWSVSSTIGNSITETLTSKGIGLQFSTDRDTTFKVVSFNGTTQTTLDTTITPVADTVYVFELEIVTATSVLWRLSVAGSVVANGTVTTNLPASTDTFYHLACVQTRTAAVRTARTYTSDTYTPA
jgi:hypothetical protein